MFLIDYTAIECGCSMKKRTISVVRKELWEVCRILVFREHGNDCYTCGQTDLQGRNLQCGHFITQSTCSTELAYDLRNLRPQCFSCNINKSGNWLAFETRLIEDHGQSYVDELKTRNKQTKGNKYGMFWLEMKLAELKTLI